MITLIKILTFPVWFPLKILWLASKVLAFVFLSLTLAALIYLAIRFF